MGTHSHARKGGGLVNEIEKGRKKEGEAFRKGKSIDWIRGRKKRGRALTMKRAQKKPSPGLDILSGTGGGLSLRKSGKNRAAYCGTET